MNKKMNARQLVKYLAVNYNLNISITAIEKGMIDKYLDKKHDPHKEKYTEEDAQIIARYKLLLDIFRLGHGGYGKKIVDEEYEAKIKNFVVNYSVEALRSILEVELIFDTRSEDLYKIINSCKKHNRSLGEVNWGLVYRDFKRQLNNIKEGKKEDIMINIDKLMWSNSILSNGLSNGMHVNMLLSILIIDNCDPLLMDWILDESEDIGGFSKLLAANGFDQDTISSLREDYRKGLSVEDFNELYYDYLDNNFFKIHEFADYIKNKFGDNWFTKGVNIEIIKKEVVDFGLQLPNFEQYLSSTEPTYRLA